MLYAAPSCPECSSRHTRWLPATSELAVVDYFRCDACGAVWVVDEINQHVHHVTPVKTAKKSPSVTFLYVDVDAGLLFARLARESDIPDVRARLRLKGLRAYETVTRLLPKAAMAKMDRDRLSEALAILEREIAKISA